MKDLSPTPSSSSRMRGSSDKRLLEEGNFYNVTMATIFNFLGSFQAILDPRIREDDDGVVLEKKKNIKLSSLRNVSYNFLKEKMSKQRAHHVKLICCSSTLRNFFLISCTVEVHDSKILLGN